MTDSFLFELEQPRDAVVDDAGVQRIDNELPVPFREDEIRLPEQIQMVGNSRFGDLEMVGNGPGGEVSAP
jgi:hypothetical protein